MPDQSALKTHHSSLSKMSENILEETCLYWLEELGWNTIHGPDIAPDTPDAERDSYSEVILKDRLRTALSQINPDVPAVGINEAVKKLLVTDSPDLLVNNRNFHRLLTDGVDVEEPSSDEYGGTRHLHDALPKASFIGFTGTPIESDEKSTPAVFGDYIDKYDILRTVEDGATFPIYYESRLARVELSEAQLLEIDPEFEQITEAEEETGKQKLKTKWAALEAMVGADDRIKLVVRDLVAHFEKRLDTMDGKAMIVCMSRRICVDIYNALKEIRPDWHSDDESEGFMKIVMSGSASDHIDWQPHIRNKAGREDLAKRFKDPNNGLKLVIVRDMWLTGFDCPSMHTMYIDKPMSGHNLMQAIARVNRVFRDKPGGLVVDYIGLADSLKRALANYTASGGKGDATVDQEQVAAVLMEKYEVVRDMMHGFDYRAVIEDIPAKRISGITQAMEFILGQDDGKKRYFPAVSALTKAFALAVPHEKAIQIRDAVGFFQEVRAALVKTTGDEQGRTPDEIDSAIKQLVSRAVASTEVVDIFEAAGMDKPDISIFEMCDDSSGNIGDVFRYDAKELFVDYATRCSGKDKIADIILKVNQKDNYGIRDTLIDCAGECLPEEVIRTMIATLQKWADKEKDEYGKRHHLMLIESLARQIKDAKLFEMTRIASWGKLSTAALIDIARVYLESSDVETAHSWLKKIPEGETFQAYERDKLLEEIYHKQDDSEKLTELLFQKFRAYHSTDTLQALLDVIGQDKRDDVISDETRQILKTDRLRESDAEFLIAVGKIDDAEEYLLGRAEQLDGNHYGSLLSLAEAMEAENRHLVTSLMYRSLLISILERGYTKAYPHGIRYLKKLDKLAASVADWKELNHHEAFKAQIIEDHGRKRSFWSKYEVKK